MASGSFSGSSNPFVHTERIGDASSVPTSSRSDSTVAEDREEHFMASDSFNRIMEAMINREDVQSILQKQKETLTKFEKTNAKFGKFNELSASRFLHLNQQLKNYTKMLIDMKKDLDSIFRRIRTLKAKLVKQYGPAFQAISAGIQKLEEELGASIENEDTSSSKTLTGSQELSCESQITTYPQLKDVQEAIDQNTQEDLSQGEMQQEANICNTSSETDKGNDQPVESRNSTELDAVITEVKGVAIHTEEEDSFESKDSNVENFEEIKTQENDSSTPPDLTCVQENQDSLRTVDADEMIRTVDTSDMVQTEDNIKLSGTLDRSGMTQRADTSSTCETSMSDETPTEETSDKTIDTSQVTSDVLDPSNVIEQKA